VLNYWDGSKDGKINTNKLNNIVYKLKSFRSWRI